MHNLLIAVAALTLAAPLAAQEVNEMADMMNSLGGGGGMKGKKLAKAIDKAAEHPLGSSKNPVRANGPTGQRAYLSQLRCADGTAPSFERRGNVGPGIFGYIVDDYRVSCGATESSVLMDMYHRHAETMAVPGFTMAGANPAPAPAPTTL